jgi:hypothetical protein
MSDILKLSHYFKPISNKMREAHAVTELISADEDIKKKKQASEKLRQEKLLEASERAKESRKRTRTLSAENSIGNAIMDRRDLIDRAIDGDDADDEFFIPNASKKPWNKRVSNWRDVADHFSVYGFISTRKCYKDDLEIYKDSALKKNLKTWLKDIKDEVTDEQLDFKYKKPPRYGAKIDGELKEDMIVKMEKGLPIDDCILRENLLLHLARNNLMHLANEDGKFIYIYQRVEYCSITIISFMFLQMEFQSCDTVVNKTFKCGVKAGFRDYLHGLFTVYASTHNEEEIKTWSPSLAMSALKPKIVDFVEAGMTAIKTAEFAVVIQNAFKNDGMFEKIRADAAALGPIVVSGAIYMQSLMDSINEIDELGDNVLALLDDPNDDADVQEDIYCAESKEDSEDDDEESDSDDNDE